MARLVWVTPDFAAHPRSGGAIRSHRLVSELARHHEVSLIVVGHCADPDQVQQSTGVASLQVFPPARGVGARLIAWSRGWPLAVARGWNRAAAQAVRRTAGPGVTTIIDFSYVAAYRPVGVPYVLHLHNVESDLQAVLPQRAGWRRWEAAREHRLLRRWEHALVADPLARVVTVSRDDADRLGVAAVVVPNGTDVPQPPPPESPHGPLLFIGTLDYGPNAEGLAWWAHRVWPLLPPGSKPLRVVGRGGRAALGALADHPSLDVVGELADISGELASARAVIVPLLHGGGSRLKIVEALAWQRPVVTTSAGASGLEGLTPGVHYLSSNDPQGFAQAVLMLNDPLVTRSLVSQGRQWAEGMSWALLAPRFLSALPESPER